MMISEFLIEFNSFFSTNFTLVQFELMLSWEVSEAITAFKLSVPTGVIDTLFLSANLDNNQKTLLDFILVQSQTYNNLLKGFYFSSRYNTSLSAKKNSSKKDSLRNLIAYFFGSDFMKSCIKEDVQVNRNLVNALRLSLDRFPMELLNQDGSSNMDFILNKAQFLWTTASIKKNDHFDFAFCTLLNHLDPNENKFFILDSDSLFFSRNPQKNPPGFAFRSEAAAKSLLRQSRSVLEMQSAGERIPNNHWLTDQDIKQFFNSIGVVTSGKNRSIEIIGINFLLDRLEQFVNQENEKKSFIVNLGGHWIYVAFLFSKDRRVINVSYFDGLIESQSTVILTRKLQQSSLLHAFHLKKLDCEIIQENTWSCGDLAIQAALRDLKKSGIIAESSEINQFCKEPNQETLREEIIYKIAPQLDIVEKASLFRERVFGRFFNKNPSAILNFFSPLFSQADSNNKDPDVTPNAQPTPP